MIIRFVTIDEVPYTTSLHLSSLANDFLPSLGETFLNILHTDFVTSPWTITIGVFEKNRLLGFVVGSYNTSRFFKSIIRKHWQKFIPLFFTRIIQKPVLLKYIWQTLYYGKRFQEPSAELLIIIVSKAIRRNGIGTRLFVALQEKFNDQDIAKFLVGTHDKNKASNNFYRKLKGKFIYSIFQYDKKWNYYQFSTSI